MDFTVLPKDSWYLVLHIVLPPILGILVWLVGKKFKEFRIFIATILFSAIMLRTILRYYPHLEYQIFPWIDYLYFYTWHYLLFPVFILAILHKLPKANTRSLLVFFAIFLYCINVFYVVWLYKSQNIVLENRVTARGICMQTTKYTCGAASCVNLLSMYGIRATETEMARLCLTMKAKGIYALGAMRGLKLKCRGTKYKPNIRRLTVKQLLLTKRPGLVVLKKGFWLSHMVCLLSAKWNQFLLIDPGKGLVRMSIRDFKKEYQGNFIYLTVR